MLCTHGNFSRKVVCDTKPQGSLSHALQEDEGLAPHEHPCSSSAPTETSGMVEKLCICTVKGCSRQRPVATEPLEGGAGFSNFPLPLIHLNSKRHRRLVYSAGRRRLRSPVSATPVCSSLGSLFPTPSPKCQDGRGGLGGDVPLWR